MTKFDRSRSSADGTVDARASVSRPVASGLAHRLAAVMIGFAVLMGLTHATSAVAQTTPSTQITISSLRFLPGTVVEGRSSRLLVKGKYVGRRGVLSDSDELALRKTIQAAISFGGTAASSDYTITGNVSRASFDFENGGFVINIGVETVADDLSEQSETLTATAGSVGPVTLTITNGVPPPRVTITGLAFSPTTVAEGASSRLRISGTYTPAGALADTSGLQQQVIAAMRYSGSAATSDRTIRYGTMSTTTATSAFTLVATVAATSDTDREANETVIASAGRRASATLTIADRSIGPIITLAAAATPVTGTVGARRAHFTLTRTTDSVVAIAVSVQVGGPAIRFDGQPGGIGFIQTVQIPAGPRGQTRAFSVLVNEEHRSIGNNRIRATIVNPADLAGRYQRGTPHRATVIIPAPDLSPTATVQGTISTMAFRPARIREGETALLQVRGFYTGPLGRAILTAGEILALRQQVAAAIKYSGTATTKDRALPTVKRFRTSPGRGTFDLDIQVTATADAETDTAVETVIATTGSGAKKRSATLSIFEPGTVVRPAIRIVAADPAIVARGGARTARFTLTNSIDTAAPIGLTLIVSGPVVDPNRGDSDGGYYQSFEIPAGSKAGQRHTLSVLINEVARRANNAAIGVRIDDPRGNGQYDLGSPSKASVTVPVLTPTRQFTIASLAFAQTRVHEGGVGRLVVRGTYAPAGRLTPARSQELRQRVFDAIAFGGTAAAADRVIAQGRLQQNGKDGFTMSVLVQTAANAVQSTPKTVTATAGDRSTVLRIYNAGTLLRPRIAIAPAKPSIIGPFGARKVRFTLTSSLALDEPVLAILRAEGPIIGASGARRKFDIETQIPAGPRDRKHTITITLDEPALTASNSVVRLRITDLEGIDGVHTVDAVRAAAVTVPLTPPRPVIVIVPADPAIVGPVGGRTARFTLTSSKALTAPLSVSLSASGPVFRGTGPRGAFTFAAQMPVGAKNQKHAVTIAIDERTLRTANNAVNVAIVAPNAEQLYLVGDPGRATATVSKNTEVARRTRRIISRYMNRVAEYLTADTGRARLQERQQQAAGGGTGGGGTQPFKLGGAIKDGKEQFSGNVAVATSVSRLRGADQSAKVNRLSYLGVDPAKYGVGRNNAASATKWDVWVTGKYGYQRTGKGDERSSGHTGLLRAGVDYLVNATTLVGVIAQLDSLEDRSARQNYKVNGVGWMIGPYFEKQLSDNIYFDAKLLGGKSNNEVSPFATYTDTFETTRWLASARIKGQWQVGAWQFTPSAEIVSYRDRQDGYTDSNGIAIGSQSLRVNRLNFGPEISRRFVTPDGITIEPRFGLRGLWTIGGRQDNADDGAGPDDIAIDPLGLEKFQGRVQAGVKILTPGGLRLNLDGSYDGIGHSDRSAASVEGRVTIPLQ